MDRRFVRRLACWLIVWMAFASLHSALAASWLLLGGGTAGGAQVVEVCTSQGVRWVSLQPQQGTQADAADDAAGGNGTGSGSADGLPHCPLCRFVGDAAPDLARSDLRFARPLQDRAPPPEAPPPPGGALAHIALTAPPRAPPAALG